MWINEQNIFLLNPAWAHPAQRPPAAPETLIYHFLPLIYGKVTLANSFFCGENSPEFATVWAGGCAPRTPRYTFCLEHAHKATERPIEGYGQLRVIADLGARIWPFRMVLYFIIVIIIIINNYLSKVTKLVPSLRRDSLRSQPGGVGAGLWGGQQAHSLRVVSCRACEGPESCRACEGPEGGLPRNPPTLPRGNPGTRVRGGSRRSWARAGPPRAGP